MNAERDIFTVEEIIIPPRLRAGVNESSVTALMQSIEKIGMRTPITVRWDKDGDDDIIVLVAGRHRLEACKRLGKQLIDCVVFKGPETEARLWEIAENLHRADLTAIERSEHIAEWVRLTVEKLVQAEPVSPAGGRGNKGGMRAAERELGVGHTEAQRAIKIAGLAPEAKDAAKELGLDNNRAALLTAAKETSAEAQTAKVAQLAQERRDRDLVDRSADVLVKRDSSARLAQLIVGRFADEEVTEIVALLGVVPANVAIKAIERERRGAGWIPDSDRPVFDRTTMGTA